MRKIRALNNDIAESAIIELRRSFDMKAKRERAIIAIRRSGIINSRLPSCSSNTYE